MRTQDRDTSTTQACPPYAESRRARHQFLRPLRFPPRLLPTDPETLSDATKGGRPPPPPPRPFPLFRALGMSMGLDCLPGAGSLSLTLSQGGGESLRPLNGISTGLLRSLPGALEGGGVHVRLGSALALIISGVGSARGS